MKRCIYLGGLVIVSIILIILGVNISDIGVSFNIYLYLLEALIFAHLYGFLAIGFIFFVQGMSEMFYKEEYAKFNTAMAWLSMSALAIYIVFLTFDEVFLIDEAYKFILGLLGVPVGLSIGYFNKKVVIK